MSAYIRRLQIAAVGDDLFTHSLALAGVGKVFTINTQASGDELKERLREILSKLHADGDVGLIIAQDSLKDFIEGLRSVIELPNVIYIPDVRTLNKFDIRGYYLQLLKSYLGISLEV